MCGDKREQIVATLCDRDGMGSGDNREELEDILRDGFRGYINFTDDELFELVCDDDEIHNMLATCCAQCRATVAKHIEEGKHVGT